MLDQLAAPEAGSRWGEGVDRLGADAAGGAAGGSPGHGPSPRRPRRPLAPAVSQAAGVQLHLGEAGPAERLAGPAAAAGGWGLRSIS